MNRRELLRYLAAVAPSAGVLAAQAQDAFPSKPVRLIVASAPGGLLDIATRLYAEKMSAHLNQPVVVENVAGASSLVAARQVARVNPDGYTLLTASNTIVTIPHLNSKAGYAMKEFSAVGEMARSPSVLVVGGSSPYKSLAELVAAARKTPGQIPFGSGGMGSTSHLPVELFARQAGIKFTHVPYKAITGAIPDVVTSRVAFLMGTPTSLAELIKNGSLRALAITSEARSPKFPDVPTFKELGYGEASFEIWVGVMAPAGVPRAVRVRLAEAMDGARADANVLKRLDAMGQTISNVRTPDQFDAVLRQDEEKYRKLIKDANIPTE